MATKTTNYNLIKPDLTDDADIRVINGNMDVLDAQLKSVENSVTSGNNNAYTDVSVSDDYTWKFTKGSGANVSYDTIKKATDASALTSRTYEPNIDSTKYGKLEYYYGSLPYKGSSTVTSDSGVLQFNHGGSTPWNTAFVANNNPNKRPYMMYQGGIAGNYSVFKDLAFKDDVDVKLDKSGGNVTGNIYTTSSIFKNSNNGALILGGSTDATHGGRIQLQGEKNDGNLKLTADDGTSSNEFYINPRNGNYKFNHVDSYFNNQTDVVYFGLENAPKVALDKRGYLKVDRLGNGVFERVLCRNIIMGDWKDSWAYQFNDLLIQGGQALVGDTPTNITLPRPYNNINTYILYVTPFKAFPNQGLSAYEASGCKVSNTTISLQYLSDRYVTWLTIGGWVE